MSEILSLNYEDSRLANRTSSETGSEGERLAAEFLIENGYRLIVSNFKVPVGRNSRGAEVTGEIDLIALDGETLCFIEVKTRESDELFEPSAAVTLRKQRQIIRTAKIYRRIFGIKNVAIRYDVVSTVLANKKLPQIELKQDFWNEAKFNKPKWTRHPWQEYF
ncbi:MAG: YraN family protein [Acidobacteria bacterium]|nr:YraN family protein [Acidobacteriota bacterium]MCA1607884.1 YraN family protein [Acidobacteriota bacterium]